MTQTEGPTMTTEATLQARDLAQFTGTENWWRHGLVPRITYTDGVKYMADKGGAHWLVDKIAILNAFAGNEEPAARLRKERFQLWQLRRDDGDAADLRVDDGNGNELYRERIDFTDFPLREIDLYFTDNVILLPSEY